MEPFEARLRRAMSQRLESLRRAGVGLAPRLGEPPAPGAPATRSRAPESRSPHPAPRTPPPESRTPNPEPRIPKPEPRVPNPAPPTPLPEPRTPTSPRTPAEARTLLEVVREEVAQCRLCDELARTRTQTVFGVGNPAPRLVFFGEAPGADEDKQGEPFVGPAGQLLTKIIGAMGLTRDDVYILNTLKCRPPGNRNPAPDEVEHCRPFFERQLEILRPEFICCLGAVAAKALFEMEELSVGRMRGRLHRVGEYRVLVTYHPSYLLRTPDAKRFVWEDIKLLMAEMGLKPQER